MKAEYIDGQYVGNGILHEIELGFIPDKFEITDEAGLNSGYWLESFEDAQVATFDHDGKAILSECVISKGTTDATKLATAACLYMLSGTIATLAAAETDFTTTTHDVAKNKYASFLISLSAAAAITITKCAADTSTYAGALATLPATPEGHIPLGYIVIGTGDTAFTAQTSELSVFETFNAFSYPRGDNDRVNGITKIERTGTDGFQGLSLGTNSIINGYGVTYKWRAITYWG